MKELEQPAKISPSSAINSSWVGGGGGRGGWRIPPPPSAAVTSKSKKTNIQNPAHLFVVLFSVILIVFPLPTWASPAPARPGAAGAGCGRGPDRRGARRGARPPTRSPERRGRAPGQGAPAPRTGTAPRTPRTPLQGSGVRGQPWLNPNQKHCIYTEG